MSKPQDRSVFAITATVRENRACDGSVVANEDDSIWLRPGEWGSSWEPMKTKGACVPSWTKTLDTREDAERLLENINFGSFIPKTKTVVELRAVTKLVPKFDHWEIVESGGNR